MKALVTGFEPFGGDAVNPAEEAVHLVKPRLGDLEVATAVLPCSFAESTAALVRAIEATRPDIVLGVGQAGGRLALSLERVAINVQDARIPDNDRAQPIDVPVVARGPAAYFATLPIKAAVAALRQAGLPAEVSNSAGTFVCNHLFFGLMHRIVTRPVAAGVRGGFIHIPYLPEQAARFPGAPSMALDTVIAALRIAVATALVVREDVRETGGQLS
jgi:pyroglutamyl-peptidase